MKQNNPLTKLNPSKQEVPLLQEVPPRGVSSYPIVGGQCGFILALDEQTVSTLPSLQLHTSQKAFKTTKQQWAAASSTGERDASSLPAFVAPRSHLINY